MVDDAAHTGAMAADPSDGPQSAAPKKPKKARVAKPVAREQSAIGFPYQDLEVGIAVAQSILQSGGVALTREQLAGVMNLAVASGNFVTKVATARLFGLITNNQGKYELTNLGFTILDSDEKKQRAARAEAFLQVPLYRRVYDEFRGKQLPPRPHGLEQAFVKFGVAFKQRSNARLAFEKSARQAGYSSAGPDRLVEPIIAGGPVERNRPANAKDETETDGDRQQFDTSGDQSIGDHHPLIKGLFEELPLAKTKWDIDGRVRWLQTAANIFGLIYEAADGDSAEIKISAETQRSLNLQPKG